jgi:hypothetical protein
VPLIQFAYSLDVILGSLLANSGETEHEVDAGSLVLRVQRDPVLNGSFAPRNSRE